MCPPSRYYIIFNAFSLVLLTHELQNAGKRTSSSVHLISQSFDITDKASPLKNLLPLLSFPITTDFCMRYNTTSQSML